MNLESITVYMGSSDPNTKVDIVFLQNYGMPGEYISKVTTISPGRTEIVIPDNNFMQMLKKVVKLWLELLKVLQLLMYKYV